MKKNLLIAAALFCGSAAFAQKKENPPAPPPPAKLQQPAGPPAAPKAPDAMNGEKKYNTFLQRNSQVETLSWTSPGTVHILLKSGKEEVYHLNNAKEAKTLKEKYGQLPPPPPPPPVAPPPPPRDIQS